jgi:hypothetical protein
LFLKKKKERKEKKKQQRQKRKKKKEVARVFFSQGGICLAGCAVQDFRGCYVHLKADLRVSL